MNKIDIINEIQFKINMLKKNELCNILNLVNQNLTKANILKYPKKSDSLIKKKE